MTTAIYARISEDRQNGAGVERQLEDCHAHARRNGWTLAPAPFIDNDISASAYSRRQRPQYRAMLAEVHAGRIDRIVVWHMDRLYRQPKELEELVELARAGAVQVVSVTGGDLDLSNGDGILVARLLVSVAAKASDDASRRIMRKQQQNRQEGKPTGGPRPFGWKDQTTPDPVEAGLLVAAMDRVLAGASLNDVAHEWSAARVRGRRWNSTDVRRALARPRHAALIVHRGQLVGEAQWQPIVPRAKWEQVCAVLDGRSRFAGLPRRRSMLTGLVYCAACGAPMVRSTVSRGVRVWRCQPSPRRPDACGKVSMRASLLEDLVVSAVWQYVDGADLAELVASNTETSERVALVEQLAELERREDAAADSYGAGRINLRAMERITRDLTAQREALQAQIARLAQKDALGAYAGQQGALRGAWDGLTDDQRRAIIGEALGRVTVKPTGKVGRTVDPTRILFGLPR